MGLLVSLIGVRPGCLSYAVFGSQNYPSQPAGQFGQLWCIDGKSLYDLRVGLVYRRQGCFKMNRNIVSPPVRLLYFSCRACGVFGATGGVYYREGLRQF